MVQAWLRLETELQNYNKLLTDRARCLEGIGKLQQENANLKQMLNVYLSDSVNDHLIVPPTETFRLEPGVPQT
jgi:cell shape-determining protein MreC